MRTPVDKPYTITTQFGVPDSYAKFGYHSGIDYAVPKGRPVLSPVDGIVTYAKYHQTGGNMVMIQDSNGNHHRLMHNNRMLVSYGQKVKEGQQVAEAGTTGLSTGVHVHHDIATQQFPTSFSQFINPNTYRDKTTNPPQGGNDMADASDVKHLYRYGPLGRAADAGGLKHYTGKKTDFILNDMANSKEAKDKAAKRAQELKDLRAYADKATQIAEDRLVEINRLRAELAKQPSTPSDPNSVTISKDGLWAVITNLFKKG